MRQFFVIIACLMITAACAQEPFYLIEDFGYERAESNACIELDSFLYVAGMGRIPDTDSLYEENFHIAKYDLQGKLIKSLYYDSPLVNGGLVRIQDSNISEYQDKLLINVGVGITIYEAIFIIDKELNAVEEAIFFSLDLDEPVGMTAASHFLREDDKVIFPLPSSADKNIIGSYDLVQDTFVYFDYSLDENYIYVPLRIFPLENDTILVIGVVAMPDHNGIYNNGTAQVYFIKLDRNFNKISEKYLLLPDDRAIVSVSGAVQKSGNEIILSVLEKHRDDNGVLQSRYRPLLLSVNPHTAQLHWDTELDDGKFVIWNYTIKSMIMNQDSSSVILAGCKFTDPISGGVSLATINKIGLDGEQIWFHEFRDHYNDSYLFLDDVERTSDGYYVAVGSRSDVTPNDGFDSRVQSFIIKFDEAGMVVDRLSSTIDLIEEQEPRKVISVSPNPSKGLFTLDNIHSESLVIVLYHSSGALLKQTEMSSDLLLDLSTESAGSYFLRVLDKKGQVVQTEQLIVIP